MIEIGKNLKYPKLEFVTLTQSHLQLRDASRREKNIPLDQIVDTEITGVKKASEFSGSAEFGMSNPTFLLPTNFVFNLINLFKRKNDLVHIKVTLQNGEEFIVLGSHDLYRKLQG